MPETVVLGFILKLRDQASRGVKSALGGIEKFGKQAEESQKRLDMMRKGFQELQMAGLAVGAVGATAAAGLYTMVRGALSLEAAMARTLTMVNKTGVAFADTQSDMMDRALQLSSQMGETAEDVSNAMFQVLSVGIEPLSKEFNALSEVSLKFARVSGVDVSRSVEKLAGVTRAFGKELTDVQHTADVFVQTTRFTTTTYEELMEAFRDAAPAAGTLGGTLEDVSAILAGFAERGFKGAMAGTAFRSILARISAPTGEAAKALDQLGVQMFNADETMRPLVDVFAEMSTAVGKLTDKQRALTLRQIAGVRQSAILSGLLEVGAEKLFGWREQLRKTNAMQEAFNEVQKAASVQLRRAGIAIRNLLTSLAMPLIKPLGFLARIVAELASLFMRFVLAIPVVGFLVTAVLGLVAVSFTLAGATMIVVGTIGLLATRWWESVKAGWVAIKTAWAWVTTQKAGAAAGQLNAIGMAWQTLLTWKQIVATKAAAAAQWLLNGAMFASPIGFIIIGLMTLIGIIIVLARDWDLITDAVRNFFGWLKNLAASAGPWILTLAGPIGWITLSVIKLAEHWQKVKVMIGDVLNWMVDAWRSAWDAITGPIIRVVNSIRRAFETVRDAIADAVDWVWSKIQWLAGHLPSFLVPTGFEMGKPAPARGPVGGQLMVPATAGGAQRATPRPRVPHEAGRMPEFAAASLAAAGGGTTINIQPGAIVIHAVKVDEESARRIHFELARLIAKDKARR